MSLARPCGAMQSGETSRPGAPSLYRHPSAETNTPTTSLTSLTWARALHVPSSSVVGLERRFGRAGQRSPACTGCGPTLAGQAWPPRIRERQPLLRVRAPSASWRARDDPPPARARESGRPWQSMMFLILGATQLGVALGSRARPGSLTNPFLLVAVGAALSLQVAGVYLPALRDLLGTEPLPLADLAFACALSGLGHAVMGLQARLRPERPPSAAPVASSGTLRVTPLPGMASAAG
ncbi:cation-translocating P-type ATPase C-terminal domain-containing protein [Streptomyces sp. NPDC023998]|uniref:cation-translocating P-type ATPase C-terminal domain-containing protein n=1 Tax=Streptomyces sp. NPDC023998 TaxID=3154597 RepID=UPI0033CBBE23